MFSQSHGEYKCRNISYLTEAVMAECCEEPMTAVPFSGTHFHSVATLRDASFSPLRVTPGVNLLRYYTPTSCLFFFISSPPVDLSLGLAVSGFVCVCLSACSSVSLAVVMKAMRGNQAAFQPTFKTILGIRRET